METRCTDLHREREAVWARMLSVLATARHARAPADLDQETYAELEGELSRMVAEFEERHAGLGEVPVMKFAAELPELRALWERYYELAEALASYSDGGSKPTAG